MPKLFVFEAILLVTALSVDALAAAFSYGVNKIKIPFLSVMIINLICSAVLAAALYAGAALSHVIPPGAAAGVCCGVLCFIGVIKLFDSLIKSYIKRHNGLSKQIKFKLFSLKLMLNIYADPASADVDASKTLTAGEAAVLAFALSFDSLTAGFGAGLAATGFLWMIGFSLAAGVAFVYLGAFLGRKLSGKSTVNLSWLSGVILIALGVSKVFL